MWHQSAAQTATSRLISTHGVVGSSHSPNNAKGPQFEPGVAAGVRHEQLAVQRPEQQQAQQQLKRQQQQQRYLQQQQEQRPKGTFFNIYGTKSAAEAAPTPPAAAAAKQDRVPQRQRQREAEIDDLFDDEGFIDDREIEHHVAPTGGSRIVRHLTHKRPGGGGQEEEHEKTPDELFDNLEDTDEVAMQVDEGGGEGVGVEGEGGHEGSEGYVEGEEVIGVGVGSGVRGGGEGVGEQQEKQASAAKRRRMHVIASDSEDDD